LLYNDCQRKKEEEIKEEKGKVCQPFFNDREIEKGKELKEEIIENDSL